MNNSGWNGSAVFAFFLKLIKKNSCHKWNLNRVSSCAFYVWLVSV